MTPKLALLEEYALVARALGAPHRLMILEQLAQTERSVEVLADKVGLSVANTSQHLQHLKRAGLVAARREGRSMIHTLGDDRILDLLGLLREIAERNLAEVDRILRTHFGPSALAEPLTRDELERRLAEGSVILLDVRPSDEYAAAHIPGAANVPLSRLGETLTSLDRSKDIVAYCRGPYCVYADEAVVLLGESGFSAMRLEGGLPEWRAEGRQVIEQEL